MSRPERPFLARQYLLHVKLHTFDQAVRALELPRDELLGVMIDRELDVSVDTPRGTLHVLNAFSMAAEIVSLDTGCTTDVRVITSRGAYGHLQASRTVPDEGTVRFTMPEYLTLSGELAAQRRVMRRRLLGLLGGLTAVLLLAVTLAATVAPLLGLLLSVLMVALTMWALMTCRAPAAQLALLETLALRGGHWTPRSDAARKVQALLITDGPSPTPH